MTDNIKSTLKYCKYVITNEMTDKKLVNKVEKILISNISKNQITNDKIYKLLMLLYYNKNEFDQAKKCIQKINNATSSVYNKLFQMAIIENDFTIARKYLHKYEECLLKENYQFNNVGLHLLLDKLENKDTIIYNDNFIFNQKITNDELMTKYNEFINYLKNDKFIEAEFKLKECKEICNAYNIKVNLGIHMNLFHKVKDIKIKEIFDNIDNIDIRDYVDLCMIAADKKYDIRKMINCCNLFLNYKMYDKAIELFEKIKLYGNSILYEVEVSYLENKITENVQIDSLSYNDKKRYENIKKVAKQAYMNDKIEEAIDYYKTGLYVFNINEFNYYIGKMYYKLAILTYNKEKYFLCLNNALKYLNTYVSTGVNKYNKCVLYIVKCQQRLKNIKKINLLLDRTKQLSAFGDFEFCFENLYVNNKENDNYDFYDTKPNSLIKNINMTEEDFVKVKK